MGKEIVIGICVAVIALFLQLSGIIDFMKVVTWLMNPEAATFPEIIGMLISGLLFAILIIIIFDIIRRIIFRD